VPRQPWHGDRREEPARRLHAGRRDEQHARDQSEHLRASSYDPIKDFAPIVLAGYTTNVLVVRSDYPAKTLQELIDMAKANPGKLNYGSPAWAARRISPRKCSNR
jgi:hypothetical protein